MTSSLTKEYSLVPALDPKEKSLSPASFFPAIPIALGDALDLITYTPLDVTLQVSKLTPGVLDEIGVPAVRRNSQAAPQGLLIVYLSVAVFNQDLEPWLNFDKVPFAVEAEATPNDSPTRITLGFRGFLEYLRLSINFRKKSMTVNSPKRFVLPQSDHRHIPMPSSIVQAEELIDAGSYSSSVALVAAGLEQSLLRPTYLSSSSSVATLKNLTNTVMSLTKDETLTRDLAEIYYIRNRVVHGHEKEEVSETEARRVLSRAKKIIRKTSRST